MQRLLKGLTIGTIMVFFASAALAAPPPEKAKGEKKEKKAKGEKEAKKGKKGKKGKKEEKEKDSKTIAKEAYSDGKAKFKEGDYEGALEKFILANDTLPNPFVYLKIADCYEKLGNIVEAVSWLQKFIDEKPDAANKKEIEDRIAALNETPGKVMAESEPEGASIVLDEEETGSVTPAEIEVEPGQHTIMFEMEGFVSDSRTFEMLPGASQEISVELAKEAPVEMISEEYPEEEISEEEELGLPPEEFEEVDTKVNKGVWAAAGVAGAGIISATIFGILALNKEADFEDAKDQGPKEDETHHEYISRLEDIKDKGKVFAIVCDVSWGVAAASTLTGIIVYYATKPKAKEKKVSNVSVSPMVSPNTAGASLGFNF